MEDGLFEEDYYDMNLLDMLDEQNYEFDLFDLLEEEDIILSDRSRTELENNENCLSAIDSLVSKK